MGDRVVVLTATVGVRRRTLKKKERGIKPKVAKAEEGEDSRPGKR